VFGSNILEVAIGVVLVFLIMSLICSAIREIIETVLKQRAMDLEHGIRELLQDHDGDGLARELYSHPLVYGLYRGSYKPTDRSGMKRWFGRGGQLPSYIPADNFARAIIDLDQQGKVDSPSMRAVLRSLAQDAKGDVALLRANLERWFDSSTERIGGWYKRRTQAVLFAIGLMAAIVFNVDPIRMASRLYKDGDLRAAVTATAEKFAADNNARNDTTKAKALAVYSRNVTELHNLAAAGLPMGWKEKPKGAGWFIALIGWLTTAVAVTLGAPFWFDLLNKFMTLRSTVKPRAKEPVAPTDDGARPAGSRAQDTRHALLQEVVAVKSAAADAVPVLAGAYEPNEWRDAGEEDGDL